MLMLTDMLEVARRGEAPARGLSRQRFSSEPAAPVVVWNVCKHCNMTCPHCYVAAGSKPSPSDLDTAQARAVLADLARCGVRVVIFSGGEPLLRGDLFELMAYGRELGIAPQLSTNGVLIDAAVARRLVECGVAYVGVSIDGSRDWNDAYRGLVGGYDAALAGLSAAAAVGLRTGVRMTLTRRNVDQLRHVLAASEAVGVGRFYVSHLVYAGRGRRLVGDDLSKAETRAALLDLFAIAEQKLDEGSTVRLVTGSNDSDGPLLLEWIGARHGEPARDRVARLLLARGGNTAGEKMVDIDHRGEVHPDQFWRGATLGKLPEQSLAEVLRHPLVEELRTRAERLEGRCGRCRFVQMCRGSHRERALAVHGRLWAEDPACVMTDQEIAPQAATAQEVPAWPASSFSSAS